MTQLAWISTACIALLLSATTSNHVTAVTLTALVGTEVLLPCRISLNNSNLTQIQWRKSTEDKSFVVYNPKFGITFRVENYSSRVVFGNHSLLDGSILLKALEMEDQGMYTCMYTLFPQGIVEKLMNLTILAIPNNRAIPVPARTADSEVPVANCTSTYGNPAAEITWISESHGNYTTTLIENNNRTTTVISLYKMAPNENDDGQTVTCIISHPASNSTDTYTIKLLILYPPEVTITGYDGNWSENTRDVTLNCEAKANPPATNYTWSRLPEGLEARNASVFIKKVSNLMNGTWICEAANSIGTGKGKLEIILKDSPKGKPEFLYMIKIVAPVVGVVLIVLTVALIWRKRQTQERCVNTSQTQQDEQGIVYAALDLNVLAHTAAHGEKEEPTVYADVKYMQS